MNIYQKAFLKSLQNSYDNYELLSEQNKKEVFEYFDAYKNYKSIKQCENNIHDIARYHACFTDPINWSYFKQCMIKAKKSTGVENPNVTIIDPIEDKYDEEYNIKKIWEKYLDDCPCFVVGFPTGNIFVVCKRR